ncbi:hypothetical protein RIF29_15886 [Crotalaria pallida]|uniref:Uncharacterized protein n=1 Tax=Crotalaria pallida TaxID=3830 RepID=A0AAN9FEE0_CROPI
MNEQKWSNNGLESLEELQGLGVAVPILSELGKQTCVEFKGDLGWALEVASSCRKIIEENASRSSRMGPIRDPAEDARELWRMGKELGLLSVEGDEMMVRRLTEMEMKDMGIDVQNGKT